MRPNEDHEQQLRQLTRAANATVQHPEVDRTVAGPMTRQLVTISPNSSVEEAHRLSRAQAVHHLLVVEGIRLEGVLCGCDLSRAEPKQTVGDLMTYLPVTVDSRTSLTEAARIMRERNIGCLPVIHNLCLVGIITRGDLRRRGLFPGRDASRICVACGESHQLLCPDGAISAFCLDCLDRWRAPAEH